MQIMGENPLTPDKLPFQGSEVHILALWLKLFSSEENLAP